MECGRDLFKQEKAATKSGDMSNSVRWLPSLSR